jgi:hypothetical protein
MRYKCERRKAVSSEELQPDFVQLYECEREAEVTRNLEQDFVNGRGAASLALDVQKDFES